MTHFKTMSNFSKLVLYLQLLQISGERLYIIILGQSRIIVCTNFVELESSILQA